MPSSTSRSTSRSLFRARLRRFTDTRLLVCATAALGLLAAPNAHADDAGERGRVVKLQINAPGSALHATFTGAVTLRRASGETKQYHWGGSTCPGQKLDAAQVALLAQTHFNRHRTWLRPYYSPSEGGDKNCLVGFELSA